MVERCLLALRLAALVAVCWPALAQIAAAQSPSCWRIGSVPGPEDLVADRSRRNPRLLVSSQERRTKPRPQGAIHSVSADGSSPAQPLRLEGRDDCSFHPLGISLVQSGDVSLLYVINHHESEDTSPRKSCLPGGERLARHGTEFTSVEVFRVEANRLRFLQRLADPEVLTSGNDLVALPDGDFYVTAPPAGLVPTLQDLATEKGGGSSVIEFRCRQRSRQRCTGEFRNLATLGRFVNGIEARELDSGDRLVYVASSLEQKLYELRLPPRDAERPDSWQPTRRSIEVAPGLDNLSWTSDDKSLLLAAAHPAARKFLQHSRSPEAASPSQVWIIDPHGARAEAPLFSDSGSLISGASSAICLDSGVILGQVFESAVLRCSLPDSPCAPGKEASR